MADLDDELKTHVSVCPAGRKLDKLTREEVLTSSAQKSEGYACLGLLGRVRATSLLSVDITVASLDDRVAGVDDRVKDKVAEVIDWVVRIFAFSQYT